MKRVLMLLSVLLMGLVFTACGKQTGTDSNSKETIEQTTTAEEITTQEETTEEPETETETEAYVGAYTLLNRETLNPQKSGYAELDTLIDNLIAKVVTEDMNNYKKVWACYEYLVDNIKYSRGMDANTGAYSSSDVSVTPTEVLWATDLLNSGMGCCYNYSAAFTYIMKALGYEAELVKGNVPAYAGGETPHCWLIVTLGGKQYTFDPDLDMNYYTRDISEGIENPAKDRFFCVPIETMSYFYKAD